MKKLLVCLIALLISTPVIADDIDPEFPFWVETDRDSISIAINAAGTYFIDWGDNTDVQEIYISEQNPFLNISHSFQDGITTHRIRIGGQATMYENNVTDGNAAAIFFHGCTSTSDVNGCSDCKLTAMGGCVGCIFPTLGDGNEPGQQPRFYRSFAGCRNMTGEIPPDLFKGIHGKPINDMFFWTFARSTFSGTIPEDLFADIEGAPTSNMFNNTFTRTNLTGEIPPELFRGLNGAPAKQMFSGTFSVAPGLNGHLSSRLFAGISGPPAEDMFRWAFYNTSITTIGEGFLSGISGPNATNALTDMFTGGTPISCLPDGLFDGITGVNLNAVFSPVPKKCSCPIECGIGYELGECGCIEYPACDAGFTRLQTGTGLSFPLYARTCTSPALYIEYGDKVCTACLVAGDASGSLNIKVGERTYHIFDPTAK